MTVSENRPEGRALVFDLRRYAINDGPGIRVTVFFKGCNLHCAWCHNPEGILPSIERMYTASRCIGCGTCVATCPEEALAPGARGIVTDVDRCKVCGQCADACPALAIEMSGREMTVDGIMEVIEKERPFFERSGGGVTFSGGEPVMQHTVLLELLEECGKRGIHRAVDTAGHVSPSILRSVAAKTDLFLYDLKVMDQELHQKWTGVGNELILSNLRMLAGLGSRIIVRIPLIAMVNDSEANICQAAAFLASLPGIKPEVQLLPYHATAENKYLKLGKHKEYQPMEEPSKSSLDQIIEWFSEYGISATAGG